MFHEQLAKITADHLRSHIKAYLGEVSAGFTGSESTTLIVPKKIDPASVVGGMITEYDKILPQYGIDVLGKTISQDDVALFAYEYAGQINGLVHSGSREAVDRLVKRHATAVELFIRRHQYLHQPVNTGFKFLEMVFAGIDFSGAEDLGEHNNRTVWLAGFSINVSWFTSEDGPIDHAP